MELQSITKILIIAEGLFDVILKFIYENRIKNFVSGLGLNNSKVESNQK